MDGVHRRHPAPLLCTLAAAALVGLTPRPTLAGEPVPDLHPNDRSVTGLRDQDPSADCPQGPNEVLLKELVKQLILFLPPTFPTAPPPAPPPPVPPPPPPPPPVVVPPPTVGPPPPVEVPPGNSTPEPATLITGLVGCGVAGLYAAHRRRRGQ